MANFTPKNRDYRVRSISFPARSHPSTVRIEQELNKLKSWQSEASPKAETINVSISGLVELHKCVEQLLSLPLTQQALAQHQKWVNEMLEESVMYIDVCNNTRDTVLVIKEGLHQLQSSLRRSKLGGNVAIEGDANAYLSSRKKTKKEAVRSLVELKQSYNHSSSANLDHQFTTVVKVLREASFLTISIFQSLLLFLSAPVGKPRPTTKWSLVSKLVAKGAAMGGNNHNYQVNELEEVEIAVSKLMLNNSHKLVDDFGHVHEKLEGLSLGIEGLESGLECLFRNLIRTRVALLNILSH